MSVRVSADELESLAFEHQTQIVMAADQATTTIDGVEYVAVLPPICGDCGREPATTQIVVGRWHSAHPVYAWLCEPCAAFHADELWHAKGVRVRGRRRGES